MALVSISEAIKLSGVSRPTFYRKHIGDKVDKGNRVSVQIIDGRKLIDTSELLRVFEVLHETNSETASNETPVHPEASEKNTIGKEKSLLAENESLKQQLQEAKDREKKSEEREAWYQEQIAEGKARAEKAEVKLLEHLSPSDPPETKKPNPELESLLREITEPKHWWQFWK